MMSIMGDYDLESLEHSLTRMDLEKYEMAFMEDSKNILAMNVCTRSDPTELCVSRHVTDNTNHVFTHRVDAEAKPVTNQKSSGRCWIFAALNVLRIPFIKEYQLEEFEFSQNFVFFWDKIERCHYFLYNVLKLLRKKESITGRLMSFLLCDPIADGGQWDMVVNVITKYGVVPKRCFPETYSCEASSKLNGILKSKIREYVRELKVMVDENANNEKLESRIKTFMEELYRIIGICLGIPPGSFTWEYYNKNKVYCSVGPITPVAFYEEYVKPYCSIENKVCVVNDPRPDNPYGHNYTVDCLGNMVGGRKTIYLNAPIEELLKVSVESLKNNEPVWFGCEIDKRFYGKAGIQDLQVLDFKLLFGVEVNTNLSKAERLIYGDSMMNHAMVLTAVSLDAQGSPTKWRVENSWGEDRGDKGYLIMTTEWFKEFVFEVVVDERLISPEGLLALEKEPKVLPAWDPMGSLA